MISVLLVDDHEMFRDGMKALIAKIEGFEVVAEAGNGAEALEKLKNGGIDLIVTDIQMPEMDGIAMTREVRKNFPEIKILVLTMVGDNRYVQAINDSGAHGYVTKSISLDQLKSVLTAIRNEENHFQLSGAAVNNTYIENKAFSELTSRELEILSLIAQGLTDKTIAQKLSISHYTVITHRKNLLSKLGLSNKVELARFALEHGLGGVNFE